MDLDDQFSLDHLIFKERTCRSCGKTKSLMDDFYLTHKQNRTIQSSYSYECKECTIIRVVANRMTNKVLDKWEYPDW